jgi:hypothetical protein
MPSLTRAPRAIPDELDDRLEFVTDAGATAVDMAGLDRALAALLLALAGAEEARGLMEVLVDRSASTISVAGEAGAPGSGQK